jgi:CBS-domain-containing membrane protein
MSRQLLGFDLGYLHLLGKSARDYLTALRGSIADVSARSLVFVRRRVLPRLTLVWLFTRQSQREVCTCDANSSIDHAVKQLIARHVHRLFVIDDQRRLLGVVSIRDILKTLLNPFET